MKLLNIFKKKDKKIKEFDYDINDLKKIPKNQRERALQRYKEYKKGIVIELNKDVDWKKHVKDKIKEWENI